MFEILNILVALWMVLFHTRKWRDEMNSQGDDWIRFLKYKQQETNKQEKKQYGRTISVFEKRRETLDVSVIICEYSIIAIIVLAFAYLCIYSISMFLKPGISALFTMILFFLSGALIEFLARKTIPNLTGVNAEKLLFVVSVILGIALIIRKADVGMLVICLALGKYIWVDCFLKKKSVFTEIVNAFKDEHCAVILSFSMLVTYLILYGFYRFTLYVAPPECTGIMMTCAYIVSVSSKVSFGSGLGITTKATKNAVDDIITKGQHDSGHKR